MPCCESAISGGFSRNLIARVPACGDYPADWGHFPGLGSERSTHSWPVAFFRSGAASAVSSDMTLFLKRFIGVQVLDAITSEEIEADQ